MINNINKKTIFSTLIFSTFVFCFPAITFAYEGLVPCGGSGATDTPTTPCNLCHLFEGIQNLINWGEIVLVTIAVVAIVAGAIMYIISAGDSGMMESAKGVIKQALWGVVIVLGAWVIVNTALWLLTSKIYKGGSGDAKLGISNWYDFQCEGGGGTGDDGTVPGGPTTCTSFTYSGWSACQPNGTRTRVIASQRPSGCSGGTPGSLQESCTYDPSACTSFTYAEWNPTPCTVGQTQTRTATGAPAGCTSEPDPDDISRTCPLPGVIPKECLPHEEAFDTASGGDINKKCLLVGIAMTESGCNKDISTSSHGACGIMQMKPSTANMTCEALRANPDASIQKAAEVYNNYKSIIQNYNSKYGYSIGTDDEIAAYNAGPGDGINPDKTKQPFALSSDCPNPPTPAWQCPINPVGFAQTQDYVRDVQARQNSCLGN